MRDPESIWAGSLTAFKTDLGGGGVDLNDERRVDVDLEAQLLLRRNRLQLLQYLPQAKPQVTTGATQTGFASLQCGWTTCHRCNRWVSLKICSSKTPIMKVEKGSIWCIEQGTASRSQFSRQATRDPAFDTASRVRHRA